MGKFPVPVGPMKPKIFVTRQIPKPAMDLLFLHFDVEFNKEDRVLTKKEIVKGVKGKDALLCLLTDSIDAEVLDAEPNLKMVSNYAVGFNNVDVKAATHHGILVTNTPGVLTDATADFAFTLLLAAARLVGEAERFVRKGKFKGWGPLHFLGQSTEDATLGIFGLGRIGREVARRAAQGFEMKILYHDVQRVPDFEKEFGAKFVDKETLLRESDFVSLHVPLNPNTHHLIGEKEFKLMKPTAVLVNTSRGPVVDEKALAQALQEKRIFAAGLDVYEREPVIEKALLKLENVVLAPHIASATVKSRTDMGLLAVNNLVSAFNGIAPDCLVNRKVLAKSRMKVT